MEWSHTLIEWSDRSPLPRAARDVIDRAITYAESATRHDQEGWFLTGSNAATVAEGLFIAALSIATNPLAIGQCIAAAKDNQRKAQAAYLWHDANCYATIATELNLTRKLVEL